MGKGWEGGGGLGGHPQGNFLKLTPISCNLRHYLIAFMISFRHKLLVNLKCLSRMSDTVHPRYKGHSYKGQSVIRDRVPGTE